MAITVPEGDPTATRKARRALSAFDTGPIPPLASDRETGGTAPMPPEPVEPIPVYAPDLFNNRSLADAEQTGWRYMVMNSDKVGAVDIGSKADAKPEMVGDPSLATRLARATRIATQRVGDSGDYELRLLDLSLVGNSLLWLANKNGQDRFFTYSESPVEVPESAVKETIARGAQQIRSMSYNKDPEAGG